MKIIGENISLPVWTEAAALRRHSDGRIEECMEPVITEHRLDIYVEGEHTASLACSPAHLAQLAVGHLAAQGLVNGAGAIASVELSPDGARADIRLVPGSALLPPSDAEALRNGPPLGGFLPKPEEIQAQAQALYDGADLFQKTGAAHSASLAVDGSVRCAFADVSRHNTVDKLVGQALMDGLDLSRAVLMTSGRIPLDMMEKVIRCGIPVVCSRSAPTSAALDLARRRDVALIGFVREGRMNVYNGNERE
jgi:FdhD protein